MIAIPANNPWHPWTLGEGIHPIQRQIPPDARGKPYMQWLATAPIVRTEPNREEKKQQKILFGGENER